MKTFELSRLTNYAKYDLAVNGKRYRNFALMFLLINAAALLFIILSKKRDAEIDLEFSSYITYATAWVNFITAISPLFIIISASLINIPLLDKLKRIHALMTPASSLEKFVWHAGLCFFGAIATVLASVILCEVLNLILVPLLLGFGKLESLTAKFFVAIYDSFRYINNLNDLQTAIMDLSIPLVSYSFITMVCTYRWRNGLLWSLLLMFAIGFIVSTALTALTMNDAFEQFFSSLFVGQNQIVAGWFFIAAMWIAILAMWYLAYRHFSNISLVNKLNKR